MREPSDSGPELDEAEGTTRRLVVCGGLAMSLLPVAGCSKTSVDAAQDPSQFDTANPTPDTDTDTGTVAVDTYSADTASDVAGIAFDVNGIPEDASLFPQAVQAGGMREHMVLLSTWIADGLPVWVRVWQPGSVEGQVILLFEAELTPGEGGYARTWAKGLAGGEWYSYTFLRADDAGGFSSRSLVGRVRTALAEDRTEPLTIALTSCNGMGNAPWPALQVTAERDYDVLIHLGDMAYNDGNDTLEEYRESWREHLEVDGYRQAFARAGLYATWDDHEFTDNFNPETLNPDRLTAAKDAYFEAVAVERRKNDVLWGSYQWGQTAEIFVLDCRSERRPSTRNTEEEIYISRDQMDWLKQRLLDSPCQFKLVVNSVPITCMPSFWDLAASDRWEGYDSQREELLNHIGDNDIRNVLFLAGDFHVCFVANLDRGALGRRGEMREIACTGGNVNILGALLEDDQFSYGTSGARATFVTLDPALDQAIVSFYRTDGGLDYLDVLAQS